MRTSISRITYLSLTAGLVTVVAVTNLYAGEPSTAGVVRISDQSSQPATLPTGTVQPVAYNSESYFTNSAPVLFHDGSSCQEGPGIRLSGNCITDWFTIKRIKFRCKQASLWRKLHNKGNSDFNDCNCSNRNNMLLRKNHLTDWHRNKFGYFYPTGCCGKGCPTIGTYNMVYAVDPQYFDARDGKLYSAQGYGVPMAVPLAPTVRHSYNYGWGIPSSRRTPISRVAPEIRYINPQ